MFIKYDMKYDEICHLFAVKKKIEILQNTDNVKKFKRNQFLFLSNQLVFRADTYYSCMLFVVVQLGINISNINLQ